MNVTLHIERLIVDEALLQRGQRAGLQAAVQAELGRLLAAGEFPATWSNGSATPHLRGGDIQVGQAANVAALGGQIAQSLYGAMGGEATRSGGTR